MAQIVKCLAEKHGPNFAVYHGDCISVLSQMPDGSIDFTIYSPPFSNLFVYSDSAADMGNATTDEEFLKHYSFLARELLRVTKPGRLVAVHCSDLPYLKWKDGFMGIKDLSGELIRIHQECGWVLQTRVTIFKDPVTEMQRTKSLGLLYKQLKKDSTRSRVGSPDYLLIFRPLEGENAEPVMHKPDEIPLEQWQQWASPVWMDIRQTETLNTGDSHTEKDERHIAPLQLDLIERAIVLWSNPGNTVFSPFMGIGSEGHVALKLKRRFIGVELKESYYKVALQHLANETEASRFFT